MSRTCLFQIMNDSLRMPQIHTSPASTSTASWLPRYIERGITMVVSSLIFRLKKCGNSKPNPNVFSDIKENWHLYIVMCKHRVWHLRVHRGFWATVPRLRIFIFTNPQSSRFPCISMSLTFIMTRRIKIFCEILLFQLLLADKGDSQRFRLDSSQQTARLTLSSVPTASDWWTLYDARYHFLELQVE